MKASRITPAALMAGGFHSVTLPPAPLPPRKANECADRVTTTLVHATVGGNYVPGYQVHLARYRLAPDGVRVTSMAEERVPTDRGLTLDEALALSATLSEAAPPPVDHRAVARIHRQIVARAFDLGRAVERTRMVRTYGLGATNPAERERMERLAAFAAGEARGHLTRLAIDVLPPPGYEVGA